MKKILFPLAALALTVSACNTTPKYTINGTVEGEQTGNVYLIKYANGVMDTLSKAALTNGKFVLNGKVDNITDAYLTVEGQRGGNPIFIENTEYTATLSTTEPTSNKIVGTPTQELFNQYMAIANDFGKKQSELYKQYGEARKTNDTAKMNAIEKEFNDLSKQAEEKEDALTKANSDTYVAAYILAGNMGRMEFEDLSKAYEELGPNAKASAPGKQIADYIQKLSAVAVGKTAPDFTLNTPEGTPLSMHAIKGKVKLIDFWASWCGPCRGENPNVVKIYEEYHPKGLEILSVSLDSDKDAWLKAIKDDNLTWNQVLDAKNEAAQLYAVTGIPHLIILDENNVIVAKDLRGDQLKAKIAELLN